MTFDSRWGAFVAPGQLPAVKRVCKISPTLRATWDLLQVSLVGCYKRGIRPVAAPGRLCGLGRILLTKIGKDMSPNIAFSKPDDQPTCVRGYMTCHHDQIANDRAQPTTPNLTLLTRSSSANGALPNHTQNIIRYHPQFKNECICSKLSGWKPLQVHVGFDLAVELLTFPMGVIQPDDFFIRITEVCPPGFNFHLGHKIELAILRAC